MHALDVYENATLTPNQFDDGAETMTGALYTFEGRLIPLSVRSVARNDAHIPNDPESLPHKSPVIGKHNVEGVDTYIDEAIFGGHIFAGWGHNITETISTAWASTEVDPSVPLVLVPWGRLWVSALPRIRETMRLAGWNDRRLILTTGSTVFGRVHVPERLIRFDELIYDGCSIPTKMNSVYDLMIDRSSTGPASSFSQPTFLARSKGHRRAHPHESMLELALTSLGYRVIEGWDLPVQDQIALINSSSCLVAFTGSSLHNSVFAKKGIPVVEIKDLRENDIDRGKKPLQESLCELRQQPFTRVEGFQDGAERALDEILSEIISATAGMPSTPKLVN